VKVLPNIKSAKKRVLISAENRRTNMSRSSALKTSLKKVTTAINAKDVAAAKANLQDAIKALDSSAGKGVVHKNQAARRKSRLAKKINAMAQ
jgi:small subunit ribosomal protein S20